MVGRRKRRVGRLPNSTTTRSSIRILRRKLESRNRLQTNSPRQTSSLTGHGTKRRGRGRPAHMGTINVTASIAIVKAGSGAENRGTDQKKSGLHIGEVATIMTAACSNDSCIASSSGASSGSGSVIMEEPGDEFVKKIWNKKKGTEEEPHRNCLERFLDIRKEIDAQRRNLAPLTPVVPPEFEDYLINRRSYTLGGSASQNWTLIEPTLHPGTPSHLESEVKDFIMGQHQERHRLRTQQLVEREKLILSIEQEIIREHNRADCGALMSKKPPFSVCTILKDEEVYKPLSERKVRFDDIERGPECRQYSRTLQSVLEELNTKWSVLKQFMLSRHRSEAGSLLATQKMDLEWKLTELDRSFPPGTKTLYLDIPLVHVPENF